MYKKIKEEELLKNPTINKVQFENVWFYRLKDIEAYLGENLENVEYITLPFLIDGRRVDTKCSTIIDIENSRKKEPLSDFDEKIKVALNFNPKKK